MLNIKNVYKSYNGKDDVLKDVSLEVESGDIFAFIGHNGAGKTTLIKSIVGILNFEKGEILVDGINVKKNPIDVKRRIAYIPDNPDIYDTLTGLQYLNFIADCFDIDEATRKDRIERYSKELSLYDKLSTYIRGYSHGMKQKLVIIGSLIHNPKILILDEPFVGLDPEASFIIKKIMKEFTDNGGSIFFSTHVLDTAEKLCNKIAIIKDGVIVKTGSMEEVKKDESLEEVFMELLEGKNA